MSEGLIEGYACDRAGNLSDVIDKCLANKSISEEDIVVPAGWKLVPIDSTIDFNKE